jgi:hypothetical protein
VVSLWFKGNVVGQIENCKIAVTGLLLFLQIMKSILAEDRRKDELQDIEGEIAEKTRCDRIAALRILAQALIAYQLSLDESNKNHQVRKTYVAA